MSRKPKFLVDRREPSALDLDALSKPLHVLSPAACGAADVSPVPLVPILL